MIDNKSLNIANKTTFAFDETVMPKGGISNRNISIVSRAEKAAAPIARKGPSACGSNSPSFLFLLTVPFPIP
jgi:hypothetical protein